MMIKAKSQRLRNLKIKRQIESDVREVREEKKQTNIPAKTTDNSNNNYTNDKFKKKIIRGFKSHIRD